MTTKQRKDARLALEATQRADAWARSPAGTPYGSRTPQLTLLPLADDTGLDAKALTRARSKK